MFVVPISPLDGASVHHITRFSLGDASCPSSLPWCDFKTDKGERDTNRKFDKRLIEQLIAGTAYKGVQKDLLGKDNKLTLEKAIQRAERHEACETHMKQLQITQQNKNTSIAAIKTHTRYYKNVEESMSLNIFLLEYCF